MENDGGEYLLMVGEYLFMVGNNGGEYLFYNNNIYSSHVRGVFVHGGK